MHNTYFLLPNMYPKIPPVAAPVQKPVAGPPVPEDVPALADGPQPALGKLRGIAFG